MMIVLKILIMLLTLAVMVMRDYNKTKDPFDKQRKTFNWRRNWWKWRKDNVIVTVLFGLIGGILSGEIGVPIINKYLSDWPEVADRAAVGTCPT